MAKITDPANSNYDFGQDFNYAVWAANSKITLTNVPWNNTYRDIVSFPTPLGRTLDQYIDDNNSFNHVIENVSYLKANTPIILSVPFNEVMKYNYLRVENPVQPIPGNDTLKPYYYFILDVKYLAPNATQLLIQLDVFQSFRNDFTLGNCYIDRGHIGIANENSFDNYGRDYLTVPEGIDIGGEYRIITRKRKAIMDTNPFAPDDGLEAGVLAPDILIVSTVDLTANAGNVAAPVLISANGTQFEGLISGAEIYVFKAGISFKTWLASVSDKPWVTQGIVSITLIPSLKRYMPEFDYNDTSVGTINTPRPVETFSQAPIIHNMFTDWRDSEEITNAILERYRHLDKLKTYPYMVIEITTWTGTPIVLKPESWNNPDATLVERATFTAPNQRVEFYPRRYNADSNSDIDNYHNVSDEDIANQTGSPNYMERFIDGGDDGGEFLDLVTKISNFPTMAITNNGAINYLASNMNSIAYQRGSADWSQTRALRANETTYDQNVAGIQASKNQTALQNAGIGGQTASQNLLLSQNQAVQGIGNVINAAGGAGVAAAGGGGAGFAGITNAVGGMVLGGILTGQQQDANNRSANVSQNVNKGINTSQTTQSSLVNDTNKSLADWAAKGDYENQVAGINAKVQDAAMIQPTTSGQLGGETMNMVGGNVEVSVRWKFIDNAAVRRVGEYWLRYGYAVKVFGNIPESLMVMSKFTYWKLVETYINSATMPEGFKQIIAGIFEKGVTVWKNPDDIGNIDLADNEPLTGVSY